MYPVDTIKTHMQASRQKFRFFRTAASLYKSDGVMRFFRGANVIASGCIPAHALYFSSYELAMQTFQLDDGELHWLADAGVGVIATLFHDLFLAPSDLIKQRMQLDKSLTF